MQKILGIYVPGLGDSRSRGQDKAIASWSKLGIDLAYMPLKWGDGEDFAPKLNRLTSEIDRLHAQSGDRIVLVGSSAGASAVLNAFAKRKSAIRAVVCICGKINNPSTIGEHIYKHNPAFKQSMQALPASLKQLTNDDRKLILSVHSLYDGKVPVADTVIDGTNEMTIHTVGHVLSIAYAFSFGKKRIEKFIRSIQ